MGEVLTDAQRRALKEIAWTTDWCWIAIDRSGRSRDHAPARRQLARRGLIEGHPMRRRVWRATAAGRAERAEAELAALKAEVDARLKTAVGAAYEECAALVDRNSIRSTSTGPELFPRFDGDQFGLAYAAAIRARAAREIERLRSRVRELSSLLDAHLGTPCEQIRHQAELAALKAETDARVKAAVDAEREALKKAVRAIHDEVSNDPSYVFGWEAACRRVQGAITARAETVGASHE